MPRSARRPGPALATARTTARATALFASLVAVLVAVSGCIAPRPAAAPAPVGAAVRATAPPDVLTRPTAWPARGIAYEIFVRAFADTDGDGIGDLRGVTRNLDHVASLGATAIWLMPISPSPSYHKYDVTDYTAVDPEYGTLDDAREMVREAHRRGIAVVLDFVVNHSSREHPWFVAAAADAQGPMRGAYVWDDSAAVRSRYRAATADTGTRMPWHRDTRQAPGDGQRYYGVFGAHMPDLNFDHPDVRRRIVAAARFWLDDVGVDGFRLDAAKHIYPDDRAADSHAFWRDFRDSLRVTRPDVYLVGEVWDRPEVAAPYLAGLPSLFNFDLAGSTVRAAATGRAADLAERLTATRAAFARTNPAYVDATFLTNHDQTRVASLLGGDAAKMRLAAAMLLTLPGAPFVYYGEEIGMPGRKPDEHIREPLLWDVPGGPRHAQTTRWVAPRDARAGTTPTVAEQDADPASLLTHYRRLAALRAAHVALSVGEIEPAALAVRAGDADGVLSFLRTAAGETLLVVHNVSGGAVAADLPPALAPFARVAYRSGDGVTVEGGTLALPPFSTVVLAR